MKYIVLLLFVANVQQLLASYSGLYVDNGLDQTVIDRNMTGKEREKFASDLLHMLGLPKKPKRSTHTPKLSGSAPKFLLEVYNSLEGDAVKNNPLLKGEDYRSVEESDSIITFLTKKHYLDSLRHEKRKHLWFDLADVPVEDTVLRSELRLYKYRTPETESYTVTIYQVLPDFDGEKGLDYVDSVNITNSYEGWLIFNMTSPFITWIVFPSMNLGLHVSVHKHSMSGHEIHHGTTGLITSNFENHEDNQAFLVAFLKYGANSGKLKPRRTRDVNVKKNRIESEVSSNTNPFIEESLWSYRDCQIQTLYVNFKELNWTDWVIAPTGYAAYYCNGICDFPLNAHLNATNHAIVQTLVHLLNPNQAPRSMCAPTTLGSLSILHYLDDNNVILRKFQNMTVKNCGCH